MIRQAKILVEQAPLMNFCQSLLKFDYAIIIFKVQKELLNYGITYWEIENIKNKMS